MSYYALQKYNSEVYLLKKHRQYYILKAKSNVCDEYIILKQLKHPGIPKPVKFYSTGVHNISKDACIIITHIPGQTLENQVLSSKCIYEIFYQLCEILMYIHQKEIYHRDVKPDNIIYDRKTNQVGLIDWEYAQRTYQRTHLRGTPYYLAPEAISEEHFGKSNDIWALGVSLYQAFTNSMPFNASTAPKLFNNITQYRVHWGHPLLPEAAINLLKRIFVPCEKRISLAEIKIILANLKD